MKNFVVFALGASLLSACSGGGGTLNSIALPNGGAHSGAAPAAHARVNVTFALKVPARAPASAKRKQYVSPSMQSLAVTLTAQNGAAVTSPQPYAVNLGTSGCPLVGGTPTCSLVVPAAVGTDTFSVATYDAAQTSGTPASLTGTVLSSATTSTTVVANVSNSVALTLNGVVASITLALTNPNPVTGTTASIGLTVSARDADGNVIVGPGAYSAPITLADSDTSGATTLSTTSVTGPGTAVTIAYDGTPSKATFSASAPAVTQTSTTLVTHISKIFIANDSFQSVNAYLPNGTLTSPAISGGFNNPNSVEIDRGGNIFVVDGGNATLTKYDAAGALLLTISAFSEPVGVAVDAAGKIYVNDNGNNNVTTFTSTGMSTTPTISGLSAPTGVAVDLSGNIYVANNGGNDVLIYSANGTLIRTITTGISAPFGVAVDSAGKIYVTNDGSNTVTTYTAGGVQTAPTIAGLNSLAGLAVDPAGNIYVLTGNVLNVYAPDGTLTSTVAPGSFQPYGVAVY